jgi:mRNA-degrading endonuclease RelE of RelBE toxin-antitoxin system
MIWRVEWTHEAVKDMRRLDKKMRERVLRAIDRLAATGQGDVRNLKPPFEDRRLRVGDWRVRFAYGADTGTIHILHVKPRSEAYRKG